jgi:hypothetical protein
MLRSLGIGRWIGFALLAMVVIAIWRMNDGNLANIADGIWGLLNRGADVVQTLWENFISAPQEGGGTSGVKKSG